MRPFPHLVPIAAHTRTKTLAEVGENETDKMPTGFLPFCLPRVWLFKAMRVETETI